LIKVFDYLTVSTDDQLVKVCNLVLFRTGHGSKITTVSLTVCTWWLVSFD